MTNHVVVSNLEQRSHAIACANKYRDVYNKCNLLFVIQKVDFHSPSSPSVLHRVGLVGEVYLSCKKDPSCELRVES